MTRELPLPDRERLPNRRASDNITIQSNGVYMTVTVGRYGDGRAGEVFTSDIKAGTSADSLLRDAAVILSIALQYGTPIETIAGAITRNRDGSATSFMGALVDHLNKESQTDEIGPREPRPQQVQPDQEPPAG